MRKLLSLLTLTILAACMNPYQQFYEPLIQESELKTDARYILNDDLPSIEYVNPESLAARNKALYEDGYYMVGYASFNGSEAGEDLLLAQGKAVKAFKILVSRSYTDTQTKVLQVTTPTTQTTYHTGSAYAGGAYGTYSGTSTTYGRTTTYTPYQVRRYDQDAVFWVKRRKGGSGAHFVEPSPEIKQQNQTNKGMMIDTIIKGGMAYNADFVEKDVIIRIGSDYPITSENITSVFTKYYGENNVEFEFYRNGKPMTKTVDVPERVITE